MPPVFFLDKIKGKEKIAYKKAHVEFLMTLAGPGHESLVTVLNSRVYFTGKQNELQENKSY